ncbi:MAG: hypothetical protein Q8N08_09335 [Methanobacteriaceae archaeon]|nr:hypothetical protein [Methanobacteriaceae archaeon]
MSKKINLFLLNTSEDKHPRTWICFKGNKLKGILKELENDALKNKKWSKNQLNKKIASQLNCAINTIGTTLREERKFYPIPIIEALLKFGKNKEKILKEITENIEYLKVNSASAKPVKAVDKLNKNLAKILGAFMADGSLSVQIIIASFQPKNLDRVKHKLMKLQIPYSSGNAPSRRQYYISVRVNRSNSNSLNKLISSFTCPIQAHYNIELTDEYKDSVEAFIRWTKEEFNINPTNFYKRRNAWRVIFSNKILARYLICFFDVMPGPKTYDAYEPEIIKKSGLAIRKEFAKGVLMFDGCVTINKKMTLVLKSEYLISSISEIWKKDKIRFGKSINKKRNEYSLFTTAENKKEKLLKYFETDTQKWKLLNWLSGDLNHTPIIKNNSLLSLEKILKILRKIERCDAIFLKNYFKCSHTAIRSYLKILRDQNKIKLSNQPKQLNEYINKDATILLKDEVHKTFFKRIKEKFRKYQNCARFLGIHKGTFSAWKVRKNRIPIRVLKKICEVLNLDFIEISKNTEKVDREIAEII